MIKMNNERNKDEHEHTFTTIKAKPVTLKENYDYFGKKWYFRVFAPIIAVLVKIFFRWLWAPIWLGFRVKNKKNIKTLKKDGHIIISNHIHPTDAVLSGTILFPKRVYFTMLQSNLGIPFFGKLMHFVGGAPIPEKREFLNEFQKQMNEALKRKAFVCVYPESALKPYYPGIRTFKKGAFRFALDSNADIIPMVYVLKKPRGIYKLFKRKPVIHLHFLPVYKMDSKGSRYETISYHTEKLQKIMSDYYNTHSDIKVR
ncbi:MAG: 1-acyl-sn-glycerol-3-phosphate acyltransferase [Acholeplasmataceae bacterium]|nr:1-acyl-sn-glycerol-3-phosphate acyltransferase [Acholeplasmataceae bacterium]